MLAKGGRLCVLLRPSGLSASSQHAVDEKCASVRHNLCPSVFTLLRKNPCPSVKSVCRKTASFAPLREIRIFWNLLLYPDVRRVGDQRQIKKLTENFRIWFLSLLPARAGCKEDNRKFPNISFRLTPTLLRRDMKNISENKRICFFASYPHVRDIRKMTENF